MSTPSALGSTAQPTSLKSCSTFTHFTQQEGRLTTNKGNIQVSVESSSRQGYLLRLFREAQKSLDIALQNQSCEIPRERLAADQDVHFHIITTGEETCIQASSDVERIRMQCSSTGQKVRGVFGRGSVVFEQETPGPCFPVANDSGSRAQEATRPLTQRAREALATLPPLVPPPPPPTQANLLTSMPLFSPRVPPPFLFSLPPGFSHPPGAFAFLAPLTPPQQVPRSSEAGQDNFSSPPSPEAPPASLVSFEAFCQWADRNVTNRPSQAETWLNSSVSSLSHFQPPFTSTPSGDNEEVESNFDESTLPAEAQKMLEPPSSTSIYAASRGFFNPVSIQELSTAGAHGQAKSSASPLSASRPEEAPRKRARNERASSEESSSPEERPTKRRKREPSV